MPSFVRAFHRLCITSFGIRSIQRQCSTSPDVNTLKALCPLVKYSIPEETRRSRTTAILVLDSKGKELQISPCVSIVRPQTTTAPIKPCQVNPYEYDVFSINIHSSHANPSLLLAVNFIVILFQTDSRESHSLATTMIAHISLQPARDQHSNFPDDNKHQTQV